MTLNCIWFKLVLSGFPYFRLCRFICMNEKIVSWFSVYHFWCLSWPSVLLFWSRVLLSCFWLRKHTPVVFPWGEVCKFHGSKQNIHSFLPDVWVDGDCHDKCLCSLVWSTQCMWLWCCCLVGGLVVLLQGSTVVSVMVCYLFLVLLIRWMTMKWTDRLWALV